MNTIRRGFAIMVVDKEDSYVRDSGGESKAHWYEGLDPLEMVLTTDDTDFTEGAEGREDRPGPPFSNITKKYSED